MMTSSISILNQRVACFQATIPFSDYLWFFGSRQTVKDPATLISVFAVM